MTNSYPSIIIAGMAGDSGKTLVSLSILSELSRLGIKTAAFKKGPDYIDAAWLGLAAQSTARHLDLYMTGEEFVLRSYVTHAVSDGINVIEGNRGLFDGMESGRNSTAELAKLLKVPVILVCSPVKMTRTAAAHVLGCLKFDPDLWIAGVILNRIAGARQEKVVRDTIEETCGIPVLGTLPKLKTKSILPDRHLGLVTPEEAVSIARHVDSFSRYCEQYINLEKILEIARAVPPLATTAEYKTDKSELHSVRVGYFADSAFTFYYPENLEALKCAGAELVRISALSNTSLPELDALYIGGGFPETHAEELESNGSLRAAVKLAADAGMPVYAECGGLIYLADTLRWKGTAYKMAGVFPVTADMHERPQGHGYCEVEVDRTNPFFPVGTVYRGHEFHYTSIVSGMDNVRSIYNVNHGVGCSNRRDGLLYKNVLAGYTHLHAGGAREWAKGIVKAAAQYKSGRRGV